MRKYQWGNRNPQCGHLTAEEIEYRRAMKIVWIGTAVLSILMFLEIIIWNI